MSLHTPPRGRNNRAPLTISAFYTPTLRKTEKSPCQTSLGRFYGSYDPRWLPGPRIAPRHRACLEQDVGLLVEQGSDWWKGWVAENVAGKAGTIHGEACRLKELCHEFRIAAAPPVRHDPDIRKNALPGSQMSIIGVEAGFLRCFQRSSLLLHEIGETVRNLVLEGFRVQRKYVGFRIAQIANYRYFTRKMLSGALDLWRGTKPKIFGA